MNPQRILANLMPRKKLSGNGSFFQVSGSCKVFILYKGFHPEPVKQFSNLQMTKRRQHAIIRERGWHLCKILQADTENPINIFTRRIPCKNIYRVFGDKIVITTYRQNKNIVYIPASTGIEENANNLMVYGSKFLQVHIGTNTFRYNADDGVDNLEAVIEYFNEYEAI